MIAVFSGVRISSRLMTEERLLETALLLCYVGLVKSQPNPSDVSRLAEAAEGAESKLPPDALAVYIIRRELVHRRESPEKSRRCCSRYSAPPPPMGMRSAQNPGCGLSREPAAPGGEC